MSQPEGTKMIMEWTNKYNDYPHPIQFNIYEESKLSSVIKLQKSIKNTQTASTVYRKSIIRMARHLIY